MRLTRFRALLMTLGILALLAMLIVSAPARLLSNLLPGETLSVAGVSGSLWRGQAARAVLRTPDGYFHLGQLRWSVRFLSLLTLAPAIELRSDWGSQRVTTVLRVRNREIRLRDLDASLPAELARQWVPVDLRGRVNLRFDELHLTEGGLREARGRVVWQDGAWHSGGVVGRLGSYVANFSRAGDAVPAPAAAQEFTAETIVAIETLDGPVLAAGQAVLGEGRYRIELDIRPGGPALDPALAQALSLFATPSQNGYLLRLSGEFGQTR